MPDIFQDIDSLDATARQRVIDRLEFRGSYAPFVAMRDSYLDALHLPPGARACELGCGTGVVSRAIAARESFDGTVIGTDLSEALVAEAERRSRAQGLDNASFRSDPGGMSGEPDDSCDLVIVHTLISHVVETAPLLAEAARISNRNAKIVVFDGDYASLVCHAGNPPEDVAVVEAMLQAVVANPHVMRDFPRLMAEAGLSLISARSDVLLEVGSAEFFETMVETYVPMAVRAGLLDEGAADEWLARFRSVCNAHQFFGSCNFVTYVSKPN